MHIYEGVMASTAAGQMVLAAGAVGAAVGTAVGLQRLDYHRVPQVAVLTSAFFVGSLVHVPLGPSSVHLVLSGLMGLVLGWSAFPAILVALLLQTVFLGLGGGLTVLGLNTMVLALPAVACYYLFHRGARSKRGATVFVAGFAAGSTAILAGAMLTGGALILTGKQFELFAHLVVVAHIPAALLEGLVTGSVVVLLRKVRPELLEAPVLVPVAQESPSS